MNTLAESAVTPDKLDLGADSGYIFATESTSSTSYVDLTTPGPAVTVTVGANGMLLVGLYSYLDSSTNENRPEVALQFSGANTIAASTKYSLVTEAHSAGSEQRFGATFLLTGLTPGSTTITAKYRRKNGTGSSLFAERQVWALPL